MPQETPPLRRGPSDATDNASTKAPETRDEAEAREANPTDPRLHPGGATGTAADPGMSSLDRERKNQI